MLLFGCNALRVKYNPETGFVDYERSGDQAFKNLQIESGTVKIRMDSSVSEDKTAQELIKQLKELKKIIKELRGSR
jgi:uncharacterized protein YqfB (UPF0267 family)